MDTSVSPDIKYESEMSLLKLTESATEYELSVSGFTSKRTGSLSRPLLVTTDTAKSSPPLITEVNCTGLI